MSKIQKISSYMIIILTGLLIWFPLFAVLGSYFIDAQLVKSFLNNSMYPSVIHTDFGDINMVTMTWTLLSKSLLFLSYVVGNIPFYIGLIVLRLIFVNYRNNHIFTISNATLYKYLGSLFFIDAFITTPISGMFSVLAATINNPPGQRLISIGFGTTTLETLFCGIVIIVISWVMLEASKLDEDQKLTV